MTTYQEPQVQAGIDGMTLVAVLLILFGGVMVFRDFHSKSEPIIHSVVEVETLIPADAEINLEDVGSGQAVPVTSEIDSRILMPYDQYTLTQGLHGYSYGHMAIDITAGKGSIIKSPIEGVVTDLFTDQYGNPTLVLENEFYRVTLLHGKYKVAKGEKISLGQMVGRESNLGLTTDMQGRSCRNLDCGYHTHLNIFDKRLGENVNPLEVIE
ncbi:MAG: M23 family metallopeptidase [Anaerolineales bacterium]|jgi:murein DD-endopeptidase MepM/ murein hydrolase activator NlpD